MPGARYLPINLIDLDTTVLNTGQLLTGNLPIGNLKLQGRDTITRFNSVASSGIAIDFPAQVSAGCVAICGHNLSLAGTVQVGLFNGPALTGQTYLSADLSVYPVGLSTTVGDVYRNEFAIFRNRAVYFPVRNDIRSVGIFLKDPTNTQGYLEVVRIALGLCKEFKYQDGFGDTPLAIESLTENFRSKGGSTISDKGVNFARSEVKKEWVDDAADWSDLVASYTRLGMDMDFFYSQFPDAGTSIGLEEFYYQGMKKFGQISAVDKWVYGLSRTSFTLEGQ
jgi:hypothetical protein